METWKESEPGLVLIQIDGLSHSQLQAAIERGRMPFLQKLLKRERYSLRPTYSGLPSTTPAVQGELFYGVAQAVPAFGFIPRGADAPVFMNDAEPAARVEAELAKQGAGLLSGGSAQSNIYTGGAAEPRFCAASMGRGSTHGAKGPATRMIAAMAYTGTLLRAVSQTLLELGVALVDFAKSLATGRLVRPELRIIPSRVAVGVLLRDAMTSSACVDAARGLPIIQLNFLGYDEKAHCRGPGSKFAHHSLRGIDRCVRRIWRAAMRSDARHYEVWVYSDHGQERVEPYELLAGKMLQEEAERLWSDASPSARNIPSPVEGATRARAGWFTGRPFSPKQSEESDAAPLHAVAIGPLGYIYFREALSPEALREFARRLVQEAQTPIAIVADGDATIAFNAQGEWSLPRDAAQVLGANHPFLEAATADLVKLCRHRDAGQILVSGWRPEGGPITFVQEFGAHGGFGAEECTAFCLMPEDAPFPAAGDAPLRPADLRSAVQAAIGQAEAFRTRCHVRPARKSVRVMTYNVHSCRGMDGRLSPERIARVIEQCDVDIAALQELDVRRARSRQIDQAKRIAECLGWNVCFAPALHAGDEHYGDAVLSRWPLELVQAATLPGSDLRPHLEPRGALLTRIVIDDQPLNIINTHLGLMRAERRLQVDALLGSDWLGRVERQSPVILCGDFNVLPTSREYRRLASHLFDVQRSNGHRRAATFSSTLPLLSLDYIFVRGLDVQRVEAPRHALVRRASDHLPLIAELTL